MGIDLSAISNQGKMEKRFDFVVKAPTMIYAIETNFYGSGGSKLNETARSYKTLAMETDTINGFTSETGENAGPPPSREGLGKRNRYGAAVSSRYRRPSDR